ncbi:outer membrane lipid asymmetry maintenance protein MlaD [Amphibiibacter pelophylacis]|uniref:Outer membrane lipid asymmetry maintenance protein MlaD n=1 Tax=Amphibiibacter pelophylacis TaxID=1799477 RepID=A0ACC6P4Q3_9BURK
MNKRSVELGVGLLVLMGVVAILFLALKSANLTSSAGSVGQSGYSLTASFDNIGGLKVRAPVRSAGVTVGRVTGIALNPKTFLADVSLEITSGLQFPDDSSIKIQTSGILGDQYLSVEAGGSEANWKPGAKVTRTQSALVLENLIGQFMMSKANEAASSGGSK